MIKSYRFQETLFQTSEFGILARQALSSQGGRQDDDPMLDMTKIAASITPLLGNISEVYGGKKIENKMWEKCILSRLARPKAWPTSPGWGWTTGL